MRPFAWSSDVRAHPLKPRQRESGVLRWPDMGREMQGELTIAGKRLDQADRIGLERDAGAEDRCRRRDLHGLTAIDPIGNRVVLAASGDGSSAHHDFGSSGPAANRELHRITALNIAR